MRQSYDLGIDLVRPTVAIATLSHALSLCSQGSGVALEFGVGYGRSLRVIAKEMPVIGFDSFLGLPEDWRPGYEKGMFSCSPPMIANSTLIIGLFEDTLPKFDFEAIRPIKLVHIDCDLYGSTKTVLEYVGPHLKTGTIIVFDEWHGYDGCEEHEQRAWKEYATDTNIDWDVIGHGPQQWSIRIV